MEDQHYFYRKDGKLVPLYWGDIVFLEAKDNHTIFYTVDAPITIRVTLNDAMKLLPKSAFGRTSRSYAIALEYIKWIKGDSVSLRTEKPVEFTITKQFSRSFFKQIVILQTNTKGKKKKEA